MAQEQSTLKSKAAAAFGWTLTALCFTAIGYFGHDLVTKYAKDKGPAASLAIPRQLIVEGTIGSAVYNPVEENVAHVEAIQEVDILPQISGYLTAVNFKEGATVKAGDILYTIDDEQYVATVKAREADLEKAKAEVARAALYLKRLQEADARAVSKIDMDKAIADDLSAKAQVLQAEATLNLARINLKHTKIVAAISGRIGKTRCNVGDYVMPSSGALSHIVQTDPIRVAFPMTDRKYVEIARQFAKSLKGEENAHRQRIRLPDDTIYAREGQWEFADNTMDSQTASIAMRIRFANPDGILVPNTYVKLLTDRIQPPTLKTVPQIAVLTSDKGSFVWKLDEKNIPALVPVKVIATVGTDTFIETDLKVGDRIVKDGIHKVIAGLPVTPAQVPAAQPAK